MKYKENTAYNTRAKRTTRVYGNIGKSTVHRGHPAKCLWRMSAKRELNRVRLRANIYGYIMNRQTYETALSRIKEMETAAQYETFIEDTYHVAKMLSIAIDSKLKYCAYFIKENRNNG